MQNRSSFRVTGNAIEKANCETCADINLAVGEEATKQKWNTVHSRFEQHMKDEDEVRVNWLNGKFEEGRITCEPCGDKNV